MRNLFFDFLNVNNDSLGTIQKKLPRKEQVKKYICTKIASHAIEEDFFFKK